MAMFLEGNSFEFSKMNIEQRMCGRTGKSPFVRDPTPERVAPSAAEAQAYGRDGGTSSLVYKNRAQCTSGNKSFIIFFDSALWIQMYTEINIWYGFLWRLVVT